MGTADRARFEALYARTFRALSAYAVRRASASDAADVVAETLLVAWRRLEHVPEPPDELPWLYAVARNVLANQRRSTGRRRAVVARLAAELEQAVRPVDDPGAVAAALRRLTKDQQEILRLAAWEGLRGEQLGAALGCSANAASIRLHRARAALGARLDRSERTSDDRTEVRRRPTDA